MTRDEIVQRMRVIRDEMDRMAIERGDLRWEYLQLNQALGRIEYTELERNTLGDES